MKKKLVHLWREDRSIIYAYAAIFTIQNLCSSALAWTQLDDGFFFFLSLMTFLDKGRKEGGSGRNDKIHTADKWYGP